MTRKDYVKIGNIINTFWRTSVENNNRVALGHVENLIDMFSIMFKEDNLLFKEELFKAFCLRKKG